MLHHGVQIVAVLAAFFAWATTHVPAQEGPMAPPCTDRPPSAPLLPGCSWLRIDIDENWQGPITTTVTGPSVEQLDQMTYEFCTEPIVHPCGTEWPDRFVNTQRTIQKVHSWTASGAVAGDVRLNGLVTRLIGEARANLTFNGQLHGEYTDILTYRDPSVGPGMHGLRADRDDRTVELGREL